MKRILMTAIAILLVTQFALARDAQGNGTRRLVQLKPDRG